MKLGTRIPSLVLKECLTLFRDPKGRIVLIMPPLLQLLIFAFAATLEVKNISMAIYNEDNGKHGIELIQRIRGSSTFKEIHFVTNHHAIRTNLDEQKVLMALHIPVNFSRDIEAKRPASLQILLDGRRSNAAQIANGYLERLVSDYMEELFPQQDRNLLSLEIIERNWFNGNLLYLWFTIPSLVGILSMLIALIITSLSVAREREMGTFDQLLVSPLKPIEILIGKTIPAVVIGIAEGLLIWAVGILLFGVPFRGSFLLLLFALFMFAMSIVGVGLFISSLCRTQQQANLGTFIFMAPAVSLSGYAAPVENMPPWLQTATWINPLKHFLVIVKGLFLKDMNFSQVWINIWPLLIISVLTLLLAGWFFRHRLG